MNGTPPSAIEAEAAGQPFLVAAFGEHEYKLAADADDWPLDDIGAGKLLPAMRELLGDQWQGFLRDYPRRRDLLMASRAFAEAAGFPAGPADRMFGGLPRLLQTLVLHGGPVEATLAGMGVDYRDRWRFDADGRRRLPLRRIYVLLIHMPYDSPLAIAVNGGKRLYSASDLLLMDVYEALTRRTHPSRPMSPQEAKTRATSEAKIEDERAKYRARHSNPRESAIALARANARAGQGNS
jgi:hypothetical protein